jgi:SAM-dependent methyltransferase
MTQDDVEWIKKLLSANLLDDPVLELGVGYGGNTCREIISDSHLHYFGTDIESTPAVDFVANFEKKEDMNTFSKVAPFGSLLVLNVLEHTFDPIRILDNCISLLKPGGKCAVLTPSIWPLHNYPIDTWRILPSFYEEYAYRRGLHLERKVFEYVGQGLIEDFRQPDGSYSYPPPCLNRLRLQQSRIIHKLFNTFGRGMLYRSHIAIGALLQKPID